MRSLIAIDLVKFFGDRRVLDGVSLTASPGQRIGLVGENGSGKSTLLRLLSGMDTADAGIITRPASIGLLHQELPFWPGQTIGEVIDDALAESRDLLRRLENPVSVADYGAALEQAERVNAWDAARLAQETVAALGISLDHNRPLATVSGGQRSRLALAALLIRQPEALLLDEPTNHLDDDAVSFVETRLRQMPGAVIAASHDRVFLDNVCTHIIDIDPTRGGITRYGGAYTAYLAAKRAERQRWEQAFAGQQDEMAALRLSIATTARQVAHDRPMRDGNKMAYGKLANRVAASVSSRVRNATHRLAVMQRDAIAKPPAVLHFQAPPLTSALDGQLVSVRDLDIPGRVRLPSLDLPAGGRLLITGANGTGKSSLLAALAGHLQAEAGTIARAPGLRIGLLTQDDHWPDLSGTPNALYGEAKVPLADLGLIAARDLDRPIGHLSVGQRRRLALALQIAHPPHLLLLDEPTNHLSLTLATELEQALETAPGAIIIASHDRWLRRQWHHPELALGKP